MAGRWRTAVDSGAVFSFVLWEPVSPGTYYDFSPASSGPGTPVLTAKDSNGTIVLSLSSAVDANGSYLALGSGSFTASDGTVLADGFWLQAYLSAVTTSIFSGQVLTFQVDFYPAGATSPVRLLSADSQLLFSDDNSVPCTCVSTTSSDAYAGFENSLLLRGYASPMEDDGRGSTTPPASPSVGQKYVVPSGATGAWAGKDGQLATYNTSGWVFTQLTNGMTSYVRDRYVRVELINYSYNPTGVTTIQPSAATVAWVEDWVAASIAGDWEGSLKGSAATAPGSPALYDKWVITDTAGWPNATTVAGVGWVATAVVDQSSAALCWVYRRPQTGRFAYFQDVAKFEYYNGSTWVVVGQNIGLEELKNVSISASIGQDGYAVALDWNGGSPRYVLSASAGGGGGGGTTWLSGAGAPGAGLGSNGNYYLDTTGNVIYGPKAGGAWPGGITLGGSGTQLRYGAGAPGGGLGINGDFYIDTVALLIYGPKAGGVWPAGTSLVGATGAAGTNGADGTGVFFGAVVDVIAASTIKENPAGVAYSFSADYSQAFLIPTGYTLARFTAQCKSAYGLYVYSVGGGGALTQLTGSGFYNGVAGVDGGGYGIATVQSPLVAVTAGQTYVVHRTSVPPGGWTQAPYGVVTKASIELFK